MCVTLFLLFDHGSVRKTGGYVSHRERELHGFLFLKNKKQSSQKTKHAKKRKQDVPCRKSSRHKKAFVNGHLSD